MYGIRDQTLKKYRPNPSIQIEMIMNKITEYTSDHQALGSHKQNPHQLKQLNEKLLRTLEEEMTKNVALKKNIEELAKR